MATLALLTCGPQLEVALETGPSRGWSLVRLAGVSRRSSLVLAAVELLVEDAGLTPAELKRVVVSRGPGSFTGIRSGLATAAGLSAAVGAEVVPYDSLLCQAARVGLEARVWAAQPGRRGELYSRAFDTAPGRSPRASGEVEIVAVAEAARRGPWVAPETLDLGGAERIAVARSGAEALLWLVAHGVPAQPLEPLYVEDPPINLAGRGGG